MRTANRDFNFVLTYASEIQISTNKAAVILNSYNVPLHSFPFRVNFISMLISSRSFTHISFLSCTLSLEYAPI